MVSIISLDSLVVVKSSLEAFNVRELSCLERPIDPNNFTRADGNRLLLQLVGGEGQSRLLDVAIHAIHAHISMFFRFSAGHSLGHKIILVGQPVDTLLTLMSNSQKQFRRVEK
jgi:hypothetical protein